MDSGTPLLGLGVLEISLTSSLPSGYNTVVDTDAQKSDWHSEDPPVKWGHPVRTLVFVCLCCCLSIPMPRKSTEQSHPLLTVQEAGSPTEGSRSWLAEGPLASLHGEEARTR